VVITGTLNNASNSGIPKPSKIEGYTNIVASSWYVIAKSLLSPTF
jgi:hypothetical protein